MGSLLHICVLQEKLNAKFQEDQKRKPNRPKAQTHQ
jgi:hypothetical protein